jgi:peptide/nickel transport system permease protein
MSGRVFQRWLGLSLVGAIVLVAIFAPWLAPYDPNMSSSKVLASPSAINVIGTDHLGRDVFSRLLYGARVSLVIGLAASVVGMAIGVPLGLVSGYVGGKFDFAAVQIIDILVSLPAIILALIITAVVGASVTNLIIILGILNWPIIARIVRGQVLILREQAFVEAARSIGCTTTRILGRHIAPSIMRVLGAQFAIATSTSIFTAASLSFLGLGLPPPAADWGGMVQSGFDYMFLNPLLTLAPGAAVTLTVLSFYLIGESAK